jgi:hypothetical protein
VADGIPEKKTLRHFWLAVEDAVTGISPLVKLELLGHGAISRLAPLFLGAPAWGQLQSSGPFSSWTTFKDAVEREFGLSPV